MAHRPARRAAGSRRIARQAAGKNQSHARARQFSLGILQARSPEAKYQLSAHDPELGAFLRSISHLTNNKTGFESGRVTALTLAVSEEAAGRKKSEVKSSN